jgi:hypothetical protein
MSYEIKITADTISELTGKLLALAAATQPDVVIGAAVVAPIDTKPKKLRGHTQAEAEQKAIADAKANKADNDARQALQDARDAGKAAASASTAVGTGSSTETKTDAAAAEPATPSADVGNQTNGPAPETSTPTSDTPAPSSEVTNSVETTTASLDFDKDVAPVVLNAVKVHTKEWVQEVLSQFGFARASQVPDEQLPELVAVLSAGPQ